MNGPPDPRATYEGRRDRFEAERAAMARRSAAFSAARLTAFLLALAAGIANELSPNPLLLAAAALLFIAFVVLVVVHGGIRRRERWLAELRDLNVEGLRRLARDWAALPERPIPVDDPHGVAADLDLFGRPAVAQLLGPVGTPRGRVTVARWLLDGAPAPEVRARQEAVRELIGWHDFREALAAHGRVAGAVEPADIDAFLAWAEGPPVRTGRAVHALSYAIPVATWSLIALGLAGVVPGSLWMLGVIAAIVLTARRGGAVRGAFRRAFSREGMFGGYPGMFETLDGLAARAPRLAELCRAASAGDASAAQLMRRLARLMHLADLRHSGFTWVIAQLLLLWDFHVARGVEQWHVEAGGRVREWLRALGEVEALASLATLAHDHPDWAFAGLDDAGPPRVEAEALGHPMLSPGKRVDNDVVIGPPGTFLFITGSNMSGKSTLLRAIGVNVTLALAGGPSCARRVRLHPVTLRTGIHVQDSVVEGVSFFMAQLQRLKEVVAAADAGGREGRPPVLYLLDEILAGTNSAERRVAATRVIRHLLGTGAIGAVTTHDLELGEQPELTAAAHAVHFSERVEAGGDGDVEMTFDYVLKPGVATSTNALRLMRAVGLGT